MSAVSVAGAAVGRPAVGYRLLGGPPLTAEHERLEDHLRRLGRRPSGSAALIEVLARSGLRGRGGAWFPTWRKWGGVARHSQANAIVVINASEGEPLSSKDKALLNHRPHLVLDGAALAAESVGASEVVLYMSRSSRGTDKQVEQALAERVHAGIAEPSIRIVRTAHRYIAGESSAVINRVSGGPSKPKFTLTRSAEKGVDDRPTLVQNAETLAHVATIARYGPEWFRRLGTESAPGSALITVCGSVRHPGVYEVDLGARLGDVLAAVGGAVSAPAGVLLGGYFGSWFGPRVFADLPLEPDGLRAQHGASLGCGVVAVLPEDGCGIVEATRIIAYLAAESAGQCGPCVNGLNALAGAMERIASSQPERADLERVHRWIGMVRDRGACHHPDGAAGQLESALNAFGDHLSVHLAGHRCFGVSATGFPTPPAQGDRWR